MFIWHYTCLSSVWKIFIWRYSYLSFRIQVKFYLLCEDFLDFWAVCPLCSHRCFNDSSNQFVLLVHLLSHVISLQFHALQHARLPWPSLSPRVCSNSCPIELVMPSNHLILCHPLFLLPSIFSGSTLDLPLLCLFLIPVNGLDSANYKAFQICFLLKTVFN